MIFKRKNTEKSEIEVSSAKKSDVSSSENGNTRGNGKTAANAIKDFFKSFAEVWEKYELLFFAIGFLTIAMAMRGVYFDFKTGDYNSFLSKWYAEIKSLGGFKGFASSVGDYTPMYKYIITILTYIPINDLYLYKAVSCIFDGILAVYVGLVVRHLVKSDVTALIAYAVTLFLPNTFLNSGVWAQCDSIFTCFTVMSFYYMLRGKEKTSMIMYAISFSFKIQAIFYAPVIVIALLKGRLKWKSLPFFAVGYIACALPAMIAGMSPADALFGAYMKQVGEYNRLTLNAPNLYQFISDKYMRDDKISAMMVLCSLGICAIACTGFYKYKGEISDKQWLLIAYAFSILLPYVLPHMHERYYYMADIFAVIFACVFVKKAYVSVLTIYPSFRVVQRYLFDYGDTKINFQFLAVIMLLGIIMLFQFIYSEFSEKNAEESLKKE